MRAHLLVLAIGLAFVCSCSEFRERPFSASNQNLSDTAVAETTTLEVDDATAQIVRDVYGVPHISSKTNRGLFVAYGYAVAEDRLWQLETYRRAGRGTLAEILGSGYLPADRFARLLGYTDEELDAQFASLSEEEQGIVTAYVDGINQYINDVVLPDPINKLPVEYFALFLDPPQPFTTRELLSFLVVVVRQFGEIGGRELRNQVFLSDLIDRYGPEAGYGIFDDARWLNDPESPASVPAAPASPVGSLKPRGVARWSQQLSGNEDSSFDSLRERALALWESLGVPTRLGSYAWVISPERSTNGHAMLYGGPQMGFNAPEIIHEVELIGGNGFHVDGLAIAGGPGVIIGHNQELAWSLTTGAPGDNLDIYAERLCDDASTYLFQGECLPFETRIEIIPIRGGSSESFEVRRTVHGPVVSTQGSFAFSQKRVHWMHEIETIRALIGFDRSSNLTEFRSRVRQINLSFNVLYADQLGHIGYFLAGLNPVRPADFDLRLPFPGDGSAEWTGEFRDNPYSISPARGWLANWNNKATADYASGDSDTFGKIFRVNDIFTRLEAGQISQQDMRDIPKDVARVKGRTGREARFFNPYLFGALDAVPPSHHLADQSRAILEAWDGSAFADAITSTDLQAGEVIFSAWLNRMMRGTFADVLGKHFNEEASSNMLIHALDFHFTGTSGVPPSRDYFNGNDPNALMSAAFDEVLAELEASQGGDPSAWSGPRGTINFVHSIIGQVASIPASNRSTYGQIIVLDPAEVRGENIFTLGQSGFIRFIPPAGFELDPHFLDLLPLYRNFEYKPMGLP